MEEISLAQILMGLGSLLVAYLFTRNGDKVKANETQVAQLTKDMEQLKATAVNEIRVREIIKDAIEPTSTTVKDIKDNLSHVGSVLQDIQLKLATELAYRRGKQDKED